MKLAAAFFISVAMVAGAANATAINGSATGIASPAYTITFSEVALAPDVTPVTNQFAAYGATFSPAAVYTPQTGFPNIDGDTLGNFSSDGSGDFFSPFTISFTTVQTDAAFAMVSNGSSYLFEALLANAVVDSFNAAIMSNSPNNFYGFTGLSFDSIRFTNLDGDFWLVDNVQIGSLVPEPASWAMMIAGFGLMGVAMRRRAKAGMRVVA